jgi:hypothetical protein
VERIQIPSKEKSAEKPSMYKCYFCNITRQEHSRLYTHIQQKHPQETYFNCDYKACLHLYFTSKKEMDAHTKEQHNSSSDGPTLWRCIYCERVYIYRQRLRIHVKEAHQNEVVRCHSKNCRTILKSEEERQQHLEEMHNVELKVKQCIYCDKVFPNYRCLWGHMRNHHLHTMVKCNYARCETYLKSEADRQQHIAEKHQTRRNMKKCVYCDQWVYLKTIIRHMSIYHNHVTIKCNYSNRCGSYFRTESDRDEHIKVVHLAGKKKLKEDCIFCGKSYPKGSSLQFHIKSMHGNIAIECSLRNCLQFFKKQEDSDKHFKKDHQEKEKSKTICCPKCSYKTNNKTLFQQHSQNKHGKEELKCSQCPGSEKTYKSKQLLKQHISSIHPSDIKICPHCNISTSLNGLWSHLVSEYCSLCKVNYLCVGTMKEHKKWCKLKCEICFQEATSETALLNHVTLFHNIVDLLKLEWLGDLRYLEKNVKCEKCERCFYNSLELIHHVRLAHAERKMLWSCDHCKKQFKTRFYLERHFLRLFHGFKKANAKNN